MEDLCSHTHYEDRQRAIDEEAVTLVVWVERRAAAISKLAEADRQIQGILYHSKESLVRVDVGTLVPVDVRKPQVGTDQEDRNE